VRRRTYLAAVSGGILSAVAGCNRSTNSSELASNNTTDTEPTPAIDAETDATFQVREQTLPDRTTVGESIEIQLVIANTGTERGRYRATLLGQPDGPELSEHQIDVTIPADETVTWTSDPIEFAYAGHIEYQLPGMDGFESHRLVVEPQSKAPRIEGVNLVSAWTTFGHAFENAIDEAPVGQPIEIADRHRYWHNEDGTYQLFRQVEILDSAGERVAITQRSEDEETEYEGFRSWEGVVWFDARSWPAGTYTAVVTLRNEVTGERSDPMSSEFALVEDTTPSSE